eukprot:s7784_g3.t1
MAWSVGRLVGRWVVQKGSCSRRSVVQKGSCSRRSVAQKGSCSRRSVVQKCSCSRRSVVQKCTSSAQEESQAGALRDDEAIPEVGSPSFSHGGRGGELRGGRCRVGCEGGAKGTTATEWHGDRGHNRCRDGGASHHHGGGLVSTLPGATGGVELPRPATAQPNGILRLLPPMREVAFSGAPAERQPYETDGTVVASRQTCFGDHDRFMDHERLEMLIQARHPLWSSNMVLFAKERVLQMESFEAQEGVYTGEIPAEFGSEEEAAASVVRPAPPTSTEEPREKKPRGAEPPPPKSGKKREKPRRTKPWPDTHGVALRSSAQMERMGGVAPPLGPLHRLFSRWRERGRQLGRLAGE